jgi:hypothetical protein
VDDIACNRYSGGRSVTKRYAPKLNLIRHLLNDDLPPTRHHLAFLLHRYEKTGCPSTCEEHVTNLNNFVVRYFALILSWLRRDMGVLQREEPLLILVARLSTVQVWRVFFTPCPTVHVINETLT